MLLFKKGDELDWKRFSAIVPWALSTFEEINLNFLAERFEELAPWKSTVSSALL